MADILLTVGVDTSLSYAEFQSGITSLVSKINSNPPKIKVAFDIDQTATNKLKQQVSAMYASMGKTGSGSAGTSYMQGIANGAKAANSQISATKAHLNAVNAALKEINATNTSITSTYKNLSKALGGATATGQNATDLSAMKSKYLELQNAVETLRTSKATATQEDINNIYRLQSEMQNLMNSTQQRITTEKEAAAAAQQAAKAEADAAKQAAQAQAEKAAQAAAAEQVEKRYYNTLNQMQTALRNYTAAENSRNATSRSSYAAIQNEANALQSAFAAYQNGSMSIDAFKQKVASANTTLASSTATIKANGDATKTLSERMGGLASKFSSWLTVSQAIMYSIQAIKKMVTASIELDTAMTELKKVTDESDATYNKFLENAESRAKKVGASLSDVVTASADFARLGYNIDDASKLADVATVYKNVGDGIQDISEASESIIATMQAFGIGADEAMSIVDKFNEVGNNYAISSEGVGEALLRSAAAMKAANNTLDETIALATAANTVVQDPEKVGTTLKTVSMFLRAAKTEAEDAGESTEGMASSVSELRDEILALTGNKVDIQIDDDTFKSTYQILKELSEVWDELTDVSQANILEMVGGKRNSNVVAALLENFSVAEAALETSANSAGSAMEENEKYLDSVQGKIDLMQASFEALSAKFMSGDLLKFFIEGATGALNLANGIAEVVESLGGLKTVLIAVSGIVLAMKLDSFKGMFLKIGSSITGFAGKMKELPSALRIAKSEGKGLSAALDLVGVSASTAQLAIGAITAAVTIAVAAYSHWRQKVEQQRQAAIDTAQESAQEADNIMNLYAAYQTASAAYASNAGSKEALTESTSALLSALGVEESEIDSLVEKYGSLDNAINSVTLDALSKAASDAKTGFNAAYDNLQDAFGNGSDWGANIAKYFGFGDGNNLLSWVEESEGLNSKIGKLLQDAGLVSEGSVGSLGGTMLIDTDSVDDIIASYDKLLQARELLQENLSEEEYNDSGAVDMIEGKISDFEETLSEYLDARDLLNESLAKQDLFEALSNDGIPETSADLKQLKEDLISAAEGSDRFSGSSEDIANAFDNAFNELGEAIPGLNDVMNQSAEVADAVSDKYALASAQITQSAEQAAESATNLISGISAAQEAVNGQQNGKSISVADFSSDELKDYRSALEYVNGTMQLNAEKVKEIAQAKADEQVAINNTNKALEQTKYLENAKQIEEYRQKLRDASFAEGETADSVQASIDALLSENSAIADTCAQYDLLSASIQEAVGSYQNWLNAQGASDYGDMATDAISAIQQIRDTYDANSDIYGNFGSKKFDAAIDFIVPDSVDGEDLSAIEKYMADFKQYLTFDDDGVVEGLNIDKFLEKSVEAGLMSYSDDDGFKVLGGKKMEDFAEGLNMSSGMVQAFFDELQLKGAEFDWGDEAVKTIGDLAIEANEAAEALRGMEGNEDLSIKMDVSDLATTEEQLSALDATIAEMDGVKAKAGVDASEVENANAVIQYCLTQKQLLSQPDVMRVDTSQVEGDIGKAISLLQEFQNAQNDLEIQSKVGADTSEAESKISSLTSEIQGLSPDIKASLSLDTTSTESIKTSIAGLSAETINVKANVDASAITGYNPESKKCDVIYNPKTDALPTSFDAINRTVNYTANTSGLPTSFSTITRYVNYVKTGDVQVNGTAHAGGTARAGGDWGTAPGGTTLVGELGREIVVDTRTGRWYTVGDNGAEFRDIPAGAIVFNHRQTEDLLAHGYVSGRASALVSGTAMVTGGYKPYKPSSSSTSRKPTSSSSSRSSSSRSSSSSSSKKSSSSKDDKDDSEIIDWIEIAIERIERAIDRLATVATSPFRKLAERINATNEELSQMSYELSLQQSAYDRYIQQANSVGLSSDLASKVKNGTIDITEYDGDTADKIKDYQEWYEKALDCKDAILELKESIAELYQNKFDDVANDYENQLSLLEHLTNAYNNGIDDLEERGYLASTKYYEALRNVEKQNIDVRKQELADLTKQMSEAINSGSIKEGSEAWYDFQNQINEVKEAIQESETAMVEFSNSIREIKWEHFDYLQEQISNITEEANFLIDLMENSDLYTDNGQLTDTGMATMGLHGQNYNVYMAQADKYAEELLKLNKEIAEDQNNTKLLERREELLEAQRDSILAAEDEKQAIVDMVRDGIELELDALQDLIDRYTESLDSAKNLYDYQKKIKEQTSEIASLQKQIAAYAGDTSEENRATVQRLQIDLSDAMEDLEETQYDHYISEQKKLLDNLYDEYEMILNERLDNIDALLSDMIDSINTNSSSICDTLLSEAEKVGYTITENEKAIWSNEGGAFSIITKYGESFLTQMTTVNDVISKIAIKIGAMVSESDKKADTTVKDTKPSTPTDKTVKPTTKPTTDKKPTNTTKSKFNEDVKRGIAAAIWIYGGSKSGWGNDPQRKKRLTEKFGSANASAVQSYINAHANNGDLYRYWVSTGKSKLSQYYYSAFKKGGLADYTGMAWLDGTPTEPEMVLNPEDTSNFIALKDAMRSIADGNSPLADLFSGDEGAANILKQLAKIESPIAARGSSIGDITYQITIPIDHVQDYNDFMNQMRKDGKFQKMIEAMTIDRLVGGSKIAKNKYQW
ncbi:MAG: phage tail tape measure protein [Eubacteriales bacterium]|nr:phage tail tape measure protein [Eubacteriales bacterium]